MMVSWGETHKRVLQRNQYSAMDPQEEKMTGEISLISLLFLPDSIEGDFCWNLLLLRCFSWEKTSVDLSFQISNYAEISQNPKVCNEKSKISIWARTFPLFSFSSSINVWHICLCINMFKIIKEMTTFIQQRSIKLIKSDSKDIYNVTKDFYLKIMLFFRIFYSLKNHESASWFQQKYEAAQLLSTFKKSPKSAWFLKDHVTLKLLKIQLCITDINLTLKYITIVKRYFKL